MYGIAGIHGIDDFLAVTVDECNLPHVTQGDGEHIFQIVFVHLLGRTFLRRHDDFPGRLHFLHAEFRRHRRFVLKITRHQLDIGFGKFAGRSPIRHTQW